MATEPQHLAVANRNQQTLKFLCSDVPTHGAWIASIAFYKALHVVEAVFANDPDIRDTHDHETRERRLKTTRKYQQINKHYEPLSRAATIARYMTVEAFESHIRPAAITGTLLGHHLRQLEKSAVGFLKDPGALVCWA